MLSDIIEKCSKNEDCLKSVNNKMATLQDLDTWKFVYSGARMNLKADIERSEAVKRYEKIDNCIDEFTEKYKHTLNATACFVTLCLYLCTNHSFAFCVTFSWESKILIPVIVMYPWSGVLETLLQLFVIGGSHMHFYSSVYMPLSLYNHVVTEYGIITYCVFVCVIYYNAAFIQYYKEFIWYTIDTLRHEENVKIVMNKEISENVINEENKEN